MTATGQPKFHLGEHHENVPESHNGTVGLIDENLWRAENEDKITSYFVLLISVAAIAGFLFGYG
jgi:SP family myo-inositol transporter-like MFS transporter 13